MSDAVPNVVFLIHPDAESCSLARREKWQKETFSAVVKILLDLEQRLVPRTKYSTGKMPDLSHLNKLQWGYKFAKKSGIKYHGISDFKAVTAENLESFEKELKLELEDGETVDFTAHTLFDNLTALVHDFKWEQHCMVSPVKAVRKRRSRDTDRSRLKRKFASTNDFENDEKKNFMFVIGPLPTSSVELEEYFQFPVRTAEEVSDVLMPNHLEMHFRKKLGIRFYWIDSRSLLPKADLSNKDGVALMKEFLHSKQGTVIPINIFLDSPRNFKCLNYDGCACKRVDANIQDTISESSLKESSDAEQTANSCNCHKFNTLCHVFPLSVILSTYFSNFKNTFSGNSRTGSIAFSDKSRSEKNSITFTCIKMFPCLQENKQNQVTLKLGQQRFTTTLPQYEELTNAELRISAVGFTPKADLPWECFDSSLFCVHYGDKRGFKNLMIGMIGDNKHLLVKEVCCNCEINSCHLLDHRLGIMQGLNACCGSLIWISRTHGRMATQIIQNLDPNVLNNPDNELTQLITLLMKDYNLQDEINKLKPAKKQGEPCAKFQPYMLESWYDTATTSRQFLELSSKLKEIKPPKKNTKQIEFENQVNDEIDAYEKENNSKETATTKISKTNEKTFESQDEMLESVMNEYTSCLESYSDQIDQMKFSSYNIVHTINKFAREQVWDNLYMKMYDLLNEHLFLSTSKIRGKDASLESKCLECKFQTLLHMECFVLLKTNLMAEKEDFIENEVESIVGLLRIISLTLGIEKMTGFLQEIILDQYAATCGKLVYEVFSDLMLPIPEQLLEYAGEKGAEDSFFDPLSVAPNSNILSTGPFSTLSSVGSHGSNDSTSLLSRQVRSRRPSHINPITSRRQIVLPEAARQGNNKHARAKTVDSARARLFSAATSNRQLATNGRQLATNDRQLATNKRQLATNERRDVTKPETLVATRILTRSSTKKTDENSNTVSSQDVVRVRRDLFASPSKSARRRALSEAQLPRKKVAAQKKPMVEAAEESRPKARRRPSVIDTPAAKQRMTALARQRLRMRRSTERGSDGRGSNETVVEESPMKNEDDGIGRVAAMEAKLKRSPRHSVMLTRRHSFYKDKGAGGSRTIARAQIVQQHNEAVPPTPVQSRGPLGDRGATAAAPAFSISPKSLLFSYSSTPGHLAKGKPNAPASQQRSRRRLQLTAGDGPKDAEKLTSPIKQEPNVTSPAKRDPGVKLLAKREEDVTSLIQHEDNTASPTKRTEMTSPVKDSMTSPTAHTSLITSLNDGDPFDDDFEKALACTTPSKLNEVTEKKSPQVSMSVDAIPGSDALPFTSYNDDERRIDDVVKDKKVETKPEQEEAVFATPKKTPRRSPRLLSSSSRKRKKREIISSPSPNQGVLRHIGPLDNYVVRTPNASARTPGTPKVTSQRKYSPNGDHIQRWPRRKRIIDASSPLTDTKRLKLDRPLLGNKPAPEPHDFFCLEGVSPLPGKDSLLPGNAAESPDLGVYIVSSSGEDSEQRIRRFDSPAAAAAQSPGFELLFRGKTTLGSPRENAPDLTSPAHGFFGTPDSLASRARSQATLFKARIGSPSSKRHVQMVLLPDD